MAFREALFPELISYGSSGGPKFKTGIFTADSGYEQRNQDWEQVRCEFDVGQSIKSRTQMDELSAFFYAVARGRAYGFRFKDHGDYRIATQLIGHGDGVTTTFQLVKTYRFTELHTGEVFTYERKITKPVWNTIAGVTVNGVPKTSPTHYTVDYTKGTITFLAAPAATHYNSAGEAEDGAIIVASAEFHVPVRFDTDHLDATQEFWETMSWPNIPLFEVRDWEEALT